MQDENKSTQVLQFCMSSLQSANLKTVQYAAICLFNHLLCFEGDKTHMNEDLAEALKIILDVLADQTIDDQETLLALVLCECRILFKN